MTLSTSSKSEAKISHIVTPDCNWIGYYGFLSIQESKEIYVFVNTNGIIIKFLLEKWHLSLERSEGFTD